MERDQQRFFVRNQFFEPQRSRLSWTSRLRGILASDLSKPECHKGRRLSFKTLAEAEKACMTMLVHLINDSDSGATPPP